ncbi:MAG: hypothetical protein ACR2IJ_04695 [Fluviibacter sp.]
MKEIVLAWINRPRPPRRTAEEIESDVWEFVVKGLVIMVLGIAFGCLYSVAFVPEDEVLAPIDAVLLEILKAAVFMGIGSLGTVSGRSGVKKIAQMIAGEDK